MGVWETVWGWGRGRRGGGGHGGGGNSGDLYRHTPKSLDNRLFYVSINVTLLAGLPIDWGWGWGWGLGWS